MQLPNTFWFQPTKNPKIPGKSILPQKKNTCNDLCGDTTDMKLCRLYVDIPKPRERSKEALQDTYVQVIAEPFFVPANQTPQNTRKIYTGANVFVLESTCSVDCTWIHRSPSIRSNIKQEQSSKMNSKDTSPTSGRGGIAGHVPAIAEPLVLPNRTP